MPRFSSFLPPLLLLFAFAVFVFHGIGGAFPPGLNHDAAWHGLVAMRILGGESLGVYLPESYGHETPYYYVMAAVFRLFGASKTGIELTATLFGALAAGLFYQILKRKTRDSWLSLGLSLLWISSSALILYSRVGWQLSALVPTALWVAAACRGSLDEPLRARFWAIQLGLSAGATLYTYNGGRAILVFVPLFWAFRLVQTRFARPVLGDAAVSCSVFGLICAPMLLYAAAHPQEWNGRAVSLLGGAGDWAGKMANLKIALGYFNFSAHGDDFFTDFPVLEGPMRALWLVGIVFALIRLKNYWPELLLFAIFLLPGVVTKPSFHRAIGTLPIVYLLACYALIALFRRAQTFSKTQLFKPVSGVAIALTVLFQLGAGWKKLYIDQLPFAWGFYPETTVVGRYLHAHPRQKSVIYAGNWPKDALLFLATTDIQKPGGNFANYQAYNTASGDGLPEIESDLASGVLARPAHFIVDAGKVEAFTARLNSRYQLHDEGELSREGAPVARLFLVQ